MKVGEKFFVFDRSKFNTIYSIVDTEPQFLKFGTLIEWDGENGKMSFSSHTGNKISNVNSYELSSGYISFDEYKKRANDISAHLSYNASKVDNIK